MKRTVEAIIRFASPLRIASIIIVLGLFWFLLFGNQGVYQMRKLISMKHNLILEKEDLNKNISELRGEKEFLEKPENLEMVIRQELGYIKPGEILIQERK